MSWNIGINSYLAFSETLTYVRSFSFSSLMRIKKIKY